MTGYILRRLLQFIPVFLGTTFVVFFLAWDFVDIALGVYSRGECPAMTGIEVAPELPIEELFFIVFRTYVTGVLHGLFSRLLQPRESTR